MFGRSAVAICSGSAPVSPPPHPSAATRGTPSTTPPAHLANPQALSFFRLIRIITAVLYPKSKWLRKANLRIVAKKMAWIRVPPVCNTGLRT